MDIVHLCSCFCNRAGKWAFDTSAFKAHIGSVWYCSVLCLELPLSNHLAKHCQVQKLQLRKKKKGGSRGKPKDFLELFKGGFKNNIFVSTSGVKMKLSTNAIVTKRKKETPPVAPSSFVATFFSLSFFLSMLKTAIVTSVVLPILDLF